MDANYYSMLGIGIASLLGLGYLLFSLKKRNPNKKMGELLSRETIKNNEFILETILMVFFMSEAMTAATVIEGGQNAGFAFGRFLMHMSISFVGAVCSITLVRDIATLFDKKPAFGFYINNFLIALILVIISFYVPFFNVEMIASNLNQSYEFEEWLYKLTHSESAYNVYLLKHDYPETRNVFAEFETVLKVSCGQGVLHLAITLLLGLRATSTAGRLKALLEKEEEEEKKKEEKGEDKKDEKKPEDKKESKFEDLLRYLLRRIDYKDNTKIESIVKTAMSVLNKMEEKDRGIVGKNLGGLRLKAEQVDGIKDADTKKKENNDLKKEIRDFFAKPRTGKAEDRGLQINVQGGN